MPSSSIFNIHSSSSAHVKIISASCLSNIKLKNHNSFLIPSLPMTQNYGLIHCLRLKCRSMWDFIMSDTHTHKTTALHHRTDKGSLRTAGGIRYCAMRHFKVRAGCNELQSCGSQTSPVDSPCIKSNPACTHSTPPLLPNNLHLTAFTHQLAYY